MNWFIGLIDIIFAAGLFLNAMLFIPQAIRLYKQKRSQDVSLATFGGFCFIQTASIIYGFVHKDYILAIGFLVSLFTCSIVTGLIIKYRATGLNKV